MANVSNKEKIINKSTSHASKCEIANCRNNIDLNTKKSYFRFPKQDYYCSQWAFACARTELIDLFLEQGSMYLYKTKKICEDHFIKENFRNPASLSQGLFKGVIPTKNLPELKTIIHIIRENKLTDELSESKSCNIKLKRSFRNRKINSRYSDDFDMTSYHGDDVITKLNIQNNTPRKRGRPKKNTC
ncbi:uncharacterized protein LOC126900867 [Daktulosphaira vitifoliae]|uniref:uncharacterized protein LOC126900867 n=1 Tax=Daktulosphaira vitifoliae TaxID=58002 RepID=UPI0021A9CE52|nr:uncharacterized protein LOC126900867 [Daktulosphaira vitifoliae]XP_050532831.1 uncharacterized protein LOC126900867 [Daktulosphaira vitifoliae]